MAAVIARFKGDDDGSASRRALWQLRQSVDLGVGRPCSPVPALRNDLAGIVQNDAADSRVHARCRAIRCQLQCATHCAFQQRIVCRSVGHSRPHPLQDELRGMGFAQLRNPSIDLEGPIDSCASRPDFHRRCWNFTSSTVSLQERNGSRTFTAGSDSHRPRSTFLTSIYSSTRAAPKNSRSTPAP